MRGALPTAILAASLAALSLLVPTRADTYVYLAPSYCANGATWQPEDLPLAYYLNEDGSDDISDFSTLETTLQSAFDAWRSPCCSSFDSSYQGTTTKTALDGYQARNGKVVLSWREQNWPSQLGHPSKTLAITRPRYQGCEITSGTILFNGTAHTFSTSTSNGAYDLNNIATHEIGHLLGLGHTPRESATMSPKYHDSMDDLGSDDKAGICSLYGGGTCFCSKDSQCYGSKECVDGTCREAPCLSDEDCTGPKTCDTDSGKCVIPSCDSAEDCPDNYRCNRDGKCVPECTICQSCKERSDCGANAVCAQIDGAGRCVTPCGTDGTCPGNSECFVVPGRWGARYHLCLNPGADSGEASDICPASYTCSFDDAPSDDVGTTDAGSGDAGLADAGKSDGGPDTSSSSCPSLGTACSATDHSKCGSDADGCMLLADGNQICTCSCTMDSDCGPGNSCVRVATGSSWCFPNDSEEMDDDGGSSCEAMTCGPNAECRGGRCVSMGDAANGGPDAGSDPAARDVIVLDESSPDRGCSQTGDSRPLSPAGWLLLLLGAGLLGGRFRRP